MLELTGIAPVLRALGILYWALAAAAIAAALWLPKKSLHKAGAALLVAGLFAVLPVRNWIEHREREAYAKAAWAHFHKLCKEKSGEKIYKTFTGVTSVLVVKPLPPATEKDLFDQYWMGDPYSSATPTADRGQSAARRLASNWRHRTGKGIQEGLEFVEIENRLTGKFVRIHRPVSNEARALIEEIVAPTSRLGVSWDDISSPEDRSYWIAASRFQIVDLADKSLVAERVGFLIEPGFGSRSGGRRPWLAARGVGPNGRSCPAAHDATDQWFTMRVLGRE